MTRLGLPGSALFAITLSVSSIAFAQVNRYTVTELGTVDDGGNVTGNQYVMNWFEVPGIATSKIRVLVNGGIGGHSRIVEVEAWDGWDSTSNVALASQGATATASSTHGAPYLPVAAINRDWKGIHWGSDPNTGSGWVDGTPGSFPDWLQIDFRESRNLTRIYVYTVQDDLASPVDPSQLLQFQKYGITAFQVQYRSGSAWVDLPNIAVSRAFKINNAGIVVGDSGYAAGPNNKIPFMWQNGVMTALGGFLGSTRWAEGSASSINSAGVIVGSSRHLKTGQQNPYQWTVGTFLDLGALGTTGTWAHDINDAATVQIVGAGETDPKSLKSRAWIWSRPTGRVLIPLLPNGTSSSATAINNLGHVVGSSNTTNSEQHAFRSIDSTVTDLGTLGGPWSTAQDVNDAGLIVGASRIDASTHGQPRHAFSYSTNGRMIDLGTLGGGIQSWAFGVNNAGVIVGNASTSSGAEKAFVYDSANGMRDLNALTPGSGWSLHVARSINGGGQIVGWGLNAAGIQRAFLLTPSLNGAPSNQALASKGATAIASSTSSPGNTAAATIDGDRKGSGWQCSTADVWDDWLQVTFAGKRILSEIHVITAQDDPFNAVKPTLSTTFTKNGITAYQVQYWDGVHWVSVPDAASGGSVTGNRNVWRKFTFPPLVTDKIRVRVNDGDTHSRIVELEAWGTT